MLFLQDLDQTKQDFKLSIKSQVMILTPDIMIQGLDLTVKIQIKSIHSIPSTRVRDAIRKIFQSYIPI